MRKGPGSVYDKWNISMNVLVKYVPVLMVHRCNFWQFVTDVAINMVPESHNCFEILLFVYICIGVGDSIVRTEVRVALTCCVHIQYSLVSRSIQLGITLNTTSFNKFLSLKQYFVKECNNFAISYSYTSTKDLWPCILSLHFL